MLFEYARDEALRRIRVVGLRRYQLPDVVALLERQVADGAWGYGALIDLRVGMLPPDDVQAVVRYIEHLSHQHGPRGPVALVAADQQTAQAYALDSARIGQAVEVFRYAFQAERWLDEQTRR